MIVVLGRGDIASGGGVRRDIQHVEKQNVIDSSHEAMVIDQGGWRRLHSNFPVPLAYFEPLPRDSRDNFTASRYHSISPPAHTLHLGIANGTSRIASTLAKKKTITDTQVLMSPAT